VLIATSNREVPGSMGMNSVSRPGRPKSRTSSLWRSIPNRKSGLRLASLGAPTRSTTFSNGAWSLFHASETVAIDRATSSANVGSPETSVRSTIMLIRQPTSGSSCGLRRPGVVVPMTTSSWPVQRQRTAFVAASSAA
jgi:hypothetical protein